MSNIKTVKVNHSGSCGDYQFSAGVEVSLPEEVLEALGKDSYEVVKSKGEDSSKDETKQVEGAQVNKMMSKPEIKK